MLESDVVNFKQEILKSMEDVMETLQEKNNQLNDLNEKIGEAHSNETVLKQTISDLTLKQYEQQQEIDKLKHMNKNQQQELKTLKIKLNIIQHKNNDTEPQVNNQESDGTPNKTSSKETSSISEEPSRSSLESSSTQTTCFSLSTNNQFSPLTDDAKTTDLPKPGPESSCESSPESCQQRIHDTRTCDSETIIMCDSNGRLLNIKRLCPGSSYTYIRCPTLSQAQEIINNNVFTKPKILIFHCGTNDLDNSEDSKVISDLLKIIDQFKAKYPECQIILSSILPRMDNQQARISKINQKIKEECLKKPNVHFVSHTSVFASYQHFYDSKHLNDYGIKIFAKNLKTAFYQVRNNSIHMSKEQKQKEIRNHNGRNSSDPLLPHITVIQVPNLSPTHESHLHL